MKSKLLTRREALLGLGAIGTWCASATSASALTRAFPHALAHTLPRALHPGLHTPPSPKLIGALVDTQDDLRLLEEIAHASFTFFWEQMHPQTGIVRDRCLASGANDAREVGSIGATAFGLTGMCIGAMRGYIDEGAARDRVRTAMRFYWTKLQHQHGFFYHFVNYRTGERYVQFKSEISSIDTALFMCGILTCREFFRDPEITDLATKIYERADWNWLLQNGRLASHGWVPETGFLPYSWSSYSEMTSIYLLGLGSATHPFPTETWNAWNRPKFEYEGIQYIGTFAPLFAHQFSHAWFDFRDRRDSYCDYFTNSATATEVHRLFCLSLRKDFPDFSEDLWGVTASDSPNGYEIWGGPPVVGHLDGTIAPCAAGGSVAFLPHATMPVLHNIKRRYGSAGAWSRYGFVDAFNPLRNWFDPDVIGIDTGITLLMVENARSRFIWNTFMKSPEARRGMERATLHEYRAEYAVS
jgi:hypothetical protein